MKSFERYFWLGELILKGNGISNLEQKVFADLRNLYFLDLSDNRLVGLKPFTFLNLDNLERLHLVGNTMFMNVVSGSFVGLSRLPVLDLSGLSIETLPSNVFRGLDSLEILRLDGNELTDISSDVFGNLERLTRLNLSGNPRVDISKESMDQLHSLKFLETDDFKYCCFVNDRVPEDRCLPKRDEFSSCQDLMRRPVLKAFLWILGLMAFLCNLFVLIWRAKEKMTVYSLCVMNLAVADFFMGLYMTILASVDAYYSGVYIQYADQWKTSWLCQVLGFLNTLSSEASVLSLCLISADRFYKIVFPFKGSKFGNKEARVALGLLWILAFLIAAIPLIPMPYFEGGFYSRSSVCLSLHITNEVSPGWEYSVAIFHAVNFTCFVFIFCAYTYIYRVINASRAGTGRHTQRPANADVALARRLILVVATDFLCWIPINIMGKTKAELSVFQYKRMLSDILHE